MPKINVDSFPASMHEIEETKVIPLDLSEQPATDYAATSPTLLANYAHIAPGESLTTSAKASSMNCGSN